MKTKGFTLVEVIIVLAIIAIIAAIAIPQVAYHSGYASQQVVCHGQDGSTIQSAPAASWTVDHGVYSSEGTDRDIFAPRPADSCRVEIHTRGRH